MELLAPIVKSYGVSDSVQALVVRGISSDKDEVLVNGGSRDQRIRNANSLPYTDEIAVNTPRE